jgi:hypothetical protein
MDVPVALLTVFPASNHRLLDVARRDVDDSMLCTISEADYGIGAEDYLAELRTIRDTGALPLTLRSSEVLTLTAFSEPSGQPVELGGSAERGHRTRAFACAVVLRAEFEGCGGGVAETALA